MKKEISDYFLNFWVHLECTWHAWYRIPGLLQFSQSSLLPSPSISRNMYQVEENSVKNCIDKFSFLIFLLSCNVMTKQSRMGAKKEARKLSDNSNGNKSIAMTLVWWIFLFRFGKIYVFHNRKRCLTTTMTIKKLSKGGQLHCMCGRCFVKETSKAIRFINL